MLKKKQREVGAPVPEAKKEEPLKACFYVKLVEFNEEANKNKEHKEVWKLEIDAEFRKKIVKCISSPRRFAFLIKESQ